MMKKKKSYIILIVIFMVLIVGNFFMVILRNYIENKMERATNQEKVSTSSTPFYQYSEPDNVFHWNLYNEKQVSFDITKPGYSYLIFHGEKEENNQNHLLIAKGDFAFWFSKDLKYMDTIGNGKNEERELDLGRDLRADWTANDTEFPASDITNKYNLARYVVLHTSHTDNLDRTEYYQSEHYSDYMDIYVNGNNDIVYAVPEDINQVSYVTAEEINTEAVQEKKITLEGEKKTNIHNLIEALGEPNYGIATSDMDAARLTYVWKIFEDGYFYYTMQADYYINGADIEKNTLKSSLSGTNISDFEYGFVRKEYIYYTNHELAKLFHAMEEGYHAESWISVEK